MEEPSSTTTTTPSSSSVVSPTTDPNSTPNEHEGGTSTSPAVVVTSLKSLPKRKGTSDSGGKKKSPKEKSGGTKGKKNGRLPSPRAGRTEGGDQKDKEKEKDEASDNEKEEVKERRSLEYSRPNSSRVEGATGPTEGQLAPPATKHQRKKSWDHGSPVDKAKHQHEGPIKLERRNSRNFEALVLAGEGSPRTSIRMRASAGKSGLSSPSRTQENHYFVLRIEEARNLRRSSVLGKSDGYCKFDIIPSGIIGARTSTIRRSLNPQWHEQFVGHRYFGMDGEPKPKTFAITVMNNKSFSADEVLGRAIIPFTESVDNWFPLEGDGAQGELRVVLRFYNGDEGKALAKVPRDHLGDIEKLCAEWEKAVTALDQGSNVTIPKWDVPCFFNINKVWTLFQYAVSKDNAELAAHLHKLGCNVDARDQTGNTALHIAAKKQLPKQINSLVRMGVDRGVENYLGGKDYKEMLRMFNDDEEDGSYFL